MRILVLGSGGREHALCWKLAQEADVHCAPGNPGIESCATLHDVKIGDLQGQIKLCHSIRPDLVVFGPENPLVDGHADALREAGFAVFGPGSDGAALEGSKAFSKTVMASAGIPTAEFVNCSDAESAREATRRMFSAGKQVAVKASGNALGKGVVVAESEAQALEAIDEMMVERAFGDAGATVVIEERLIGREFSLLTMCGESGFISLPVAQDYKRIGDGDTGPNTGGMGTYSPVPHVSAEIVRETEALMVAPLLAQLKSMGISYRGALFSGVMLTDSGPKCLEYNVRFGDPETQTVMRRLGAGFAELLLACASGMPLLSVETNDLAAITVVVANGEYPGSITQKPQVHIPEDLGSGVIAFHAGTTRQDGALVATGGRVVGVSAAAATMATAREMAYRAVAMIDLPGKRFRTDIGN